MNKRNDAENFGRAGRNREEAIEVNYVLKCASRLSSKIHSAVLRVNFAAREFYNAYQKIFHIERSTCREREEDGKTSNRLHLTMKGSK
jgi:hypothetical protein